MFREWNFISRTQFYFFLESSFCWVARSFFSAWVRDDGLEGRQWGEWFPWCSVLRDRPIGLGCPCTLASSEMSLTSADPWSLVLQRVTAELSLCHSIVICWWARTELLTPQNSWGALRHLPRAPWKLWDLSPLGVGLWLLSSWAPRSSPDAYVNHRDESTSGFSLHPGTREERNTTSLKAVVFPLRLVPQSFPRDLPLCTRTVFLQPSGGWWEWWWGCMRLRSPVIGLRILPNQPFQVLQSFPFPLLSVKG